MLIKHEGACSVKYLCSNTCVLVVSKVVTMDGIVDPDNSLDSSEN